MAIYVCAFVCVILRSEYGKVCVCVCVCLRSQTVLIDVCGRALDLEYGNVCACVCPFGLRILGMANYVGMRGAYRNVYKGKGEQICGTKYRE